MSIPVDRKFKRGDIVHIVKCLGGGMSHFESDVDAIVMYSYYDRYGGDEESKRSYCLMFDGGNAVCWYYEHQMIFVGHASELEMEKMREEFDRAHR